MEKLYNTKAIVQMILEEEPQTRNSDSLLYLQVLKQMGGNLLLMTVSEFLANMGELDAPPFESVRRARQKLQQEFPELSANEQVKAFRDEKEAEYREFARGGRYV